MSYIIEFYKNLDTINLIIFWGVIIVVLLMLIFSIIIANKNRKLERIIESKGIRTNDEDIYDDLAIKKTDVVDSNDKKIETSKEKIIVHKEMPETITTIDAKKEDTEIPIASVDIPVKEEKFIAEEHVKEYNNDFFEIPTIKKAEDKKDKIAFDNSQIEVFQKQIFEETKNKGYEKAPDTFMEYSKEKKVSTEESESNVIKKNSPYQRNILREVYPSQTSPIGTIKQDSTIKKEINETKALNTHSNSEPHHIQDIVHKEAIKVNSNYSDVKQTINDKTRYQTHTSVYPEVKRKGNYLEELSKKMSANNNDSIDRTPYELQQENDAIISYKELLQKKDSIKTIDEEDAIISIEELTKRKEEREKLYNITEKEANDDFINELKNFRSDL